MPDYSLCANCNGAGGRRTVTVAIDDCGERGPRTFHSLCMDCALLLSRLDLEGFVAAHAGRRRTLDLP